MIIYFTHKQKPCAITRGPGCLDGGLNLIDIKPPTVQSLGGFFVSLLLVVVIVDVRQQSQQEATER